ncbi:MAG: hypothetical protein CMF31_06105 [Kordiimonas sp.]|nr:hypothetical protein [Kordiimonas sp.]
MRQASGLIEIQSNGEGLYDVTASLVDWLRQQDIAEGLMTVLVQHTSASLVIQENADPDVQADLQDFFRRLVPQSPGVYRHDMEGLDDMPAHIRAALTQSQLSLPVYNRALQLGTWQGIYLFEHRTRPHRRQLAVHVIGQ